MFKIFLLASVLWIPLASYAGAGACGFAAPGALLAQADLSLRRGQESRLDIARVQEITLLTPLAREQWAESERNHPQLRLLREVLDEVQSLPSFAGREEVLLSEYHQLVPGCGALCIYRAESTMILVNPKFVDRLLADMDDDASAARKYLRFAVAHELAHVEPALSVHQHLVVDAAAARALGLGLEETAQLLRVLGQSAEGLLGSVAAADILARRDCLERLLTSSAD